MPCAICQHENRAGAKFCEECAAPLRVNPSSAPRRRVARGGLYTKCL